MKRFTVQKICERLETFEEDLPEQRAQKSKIQLRNISIADFKNCFRQSASYGKPPCLIGLDFQIKYMVQPTNQSGRKFSTPKKRLKNF